MIILKRNMQMIIEMLSHKFDSVIVVVIPSLTGAR